MNVIELIAELSTYNPYAKVEVIAHNKVEDFSITCYGNAGDTKKDCIDVSLCVDRLCVNDTQEVILKEIKVEFDSHTDDWLRNRMEEEKQRIANIVHPYKGIKTNKSLKEINVQAKRNLWQANMIGQ